MRTLLMLLVLSGVLSAQSVLLIVADDLGVERLSCYGVNAANANTPSLDALAAAGTVIETAWSAPVCSPTRAMLLTGRYPFRTGVGHIFAPSGSRFLKSSELTLAEAAPEVASAIFGKWHLADANPLFYGLPASQGFDHHVGTLTSFPNAPGPGGDTYFDWTKITNGQPSQVSAYATTELVDDAVAWIESRDGPWFAAAMFHAPHPPFHKPPQALHTLQLPPGPAADAPGIHHRAMTEAMDTEIGRLLEAVDLATTLVLFVGDNGTPGASAEGELMANHAKGTLYEGGIHVPMIAAGFGVRGGLRMGGLVSVVDVFPTVLGALGVVPPASDGVDLLRPLRIGLPSQRGIAFTELYKPNAPGGASFAVEAARSARFKLIRRNLVSGDPSLEGEEFYNLVNDPLEERDLLLTPMSPAEVEAFVALGLVLDDLGKK